jgi:hypothetical protein
MPLPPETARCAFVVLGGNTIRMPNGHPRSKARQSGVFVSEEDAGYDQQAQKWAAALGSLPIFNSQHGCRC